MELVSINRKNVWEIVKLKVKDEQSNFVAPNNYSLTEAYATNQSGYIALPFGIYHEGKPIGFVMLGYSDIGDEDEPEIVKNNYCIWRFMIDEKYQGKGYGKQAMGLVMDKILTFPCGDAVYVGCPMRKKTSVLKHFMKSLGSLKMVKFGMMKL